MALLLLALLTLGLSDSFNIPSGAGDSSEAGDSSGAEDSSVNDSSSGANLTKFGSGENETASEAGEDVTDSNNISSTESDSNEDLMTLLKTDPDAYKDKSETAFDIPNGTETESDESSLELQKPSLAPRLRYTGTNSKERVPVTSYPPNMPEHIESLDKIKSGSNDIPISTQLVAVSVIINVYFGGYC